ncbi:winged helix-turn-helix transcriptional regulator [Paenibacillus aurantiacus]|uniref:Winged helix-turn-helix transcriptional regulator n=1 Tax=Paenibacillus aurantiacus TaxID=1936118 RepID=A0ABV5KPG9_9BACL
MSGQWTVPILFALETCRGRFTPMQHHLQISPARLSENLKRMTESGLLQHLSPHERRHPALPEYVLSTSSDTAGCLRKPGTCPSCLRFILTMNIFKILSRPFSR